MHTFFLREQCHAHLILHIWLLYTYFSVFKFCLNPRMYWFHYAMICGRFMALCLGFDPLLLLQLWILWAHPFRICERRVVVNVENHSTIFMIIQIWEGILCLLRNNWLLQVGVIHCHQACKSLIHCPVLLSHMKKLLEESWNTGKDWKALIHICLLALMEPLYCQK